MSRIRGHRLNFPSLMGAYLAVNAIPDAYILVDGPDCALYKAHFIHGRHDLCSSLLRIDGRHRVSFTNVCAQSVTKDHGELVFRRLRALEEMPEPGLVLLTSLPGCSITGIDYEHLSRTAAFVMTKENLAIPPTSLLGDWLDGYAVTMEALVKHADLSGGKPAPEKVAVVGYLMDRNEGDHAGNLAELRRLLAGLGLELVATWFGGEPYAGLKAARDAGLVVSLPYGRAAARELARKTGAALVETELPFGLAATIRWVRAVAKAAGRPERAGALIEAERARVMDRVEWIVPYLFLHKTVSFLGDPRLLDGFLDIAGDMGMEVGDCFLTARQRQDESQPAGAGAQPRVWHEPDVYHEAVQRFLMEPPELIVSNTNEITRIIRRAETPIVELGFPSYFHHALADQPFMGFRGFLAFVERMADALSGARRLKLLRGESGEGGEDGEEADAGGSPSGVESAEFSGTGPLPHGEGAREETADEGGGVRR